MLWVLYIIHKQSWSRVSIQRQQVEYCLLETTTETIFLKKKYIYIYIYKLEKQHKNESIPMKTETESKLKMTTTL